MNGEKKKVSAFWIIIGALGVLDTLIISTMSNMNEGVVLPLIIGLPLIVYGLFYGRFKLWMQKGFGLFVRVLFFIAYIGFISIFILCTVIMCLAASKMPVKDADALIVLGGGVRGNIVTATVKSRLDTALGYLHKNKACKVVVSGGQGDGETSTEASVMAKYLTDRGIAPGRVLTEDRSTSTLENMLFSKMMLDEAMDKAYRAIFVTNEFHIYRAGLTAQSVGLSAQGLSSPSPWYLLPNNFLRETLAIVRTWVFGVS